MTRDWVRAAAEEIHDRLDDIEREAGEASTSAQDDDAGFRVWVDAVVKIIDEHSPGGSGQGGRDDQ